MKINNIQNLSFAKIYKVTSNTKNPDNFRVNPDVFETVMDARGTISGHRKKEPGDEQASMVLGEFLKAQIIDWDGSVDGIGLKHIGDDDYMFTGDDAKKFFAYRRESRELEPKNMLIEKTEDFLNNLRHSRKAVMAKIEDCDQAIDSIGVIPGDDDETKKEYLIRKREQYLGDLKVFENHIASVEKLLKDSKEFYRAMYTSAKAETMIESGDFDEIAFRFGEYGEISSVEVIKKNKN